MRGLSFLRIGSRYAERVVGHAATLDILADLRAAVFARVMALSPAQLARYREGDLVARLIGDVDTLDTLFLILVAPALTAIAAGLAFGVLVGVYAPVLAWSVTAVLLAGALFVPGILARVSRRPAATRRRRRRLRAPWSMTPCKDMPTSRLRLSVARRGAVSRDHPAPGGRARSRRRH